MMVYLLVLIPLLLAIAAALIPSDRLRPWLVPLAGLTQLVLVAFAVSGETLSGFQGWLLLDPLGKLVLLFISLLYFICALYVPGYLSLRTDRPARLFCVCLLTVLGMMTLM